ncbi:HutD family protein [uncultured Ilyobacter sp.]|uniref:HutD family protein n=1 Tax=uncultured Ilyobacter sp. TaxID=544433 RepID=UPI0029C92C50|nr:HutD family protein [uncultured Ilyobacter sp.]
MIIKNIRDVKEKKWSGGITRELYKDKEDFNIRISCAEINPGISNFSDFTGYNRILKILENQVILERGEQVVYLDKKNSFAFDGSERILSKSKHPVLDFNVIYKKDLISVTLKEVTGKTRISTGNNLLLLSKEDNTILETKDSARNLKKYDFTTIKGESIISISGDCLVVLWS